MRTITAVLVLLTAQSALALNIAPGSYKSASCFADVHSFKPERFKDGSSAPGGTRIVINSTSKLNTLQTEIIVLNESGAVIDGPGLCMDQETMGKNAIVQIIPTGIANDDGSTNVILSCGGFFSNIDMKAKVGLSERNELLSFNEASGIQENVLMIGPKTVSRLDCGTFDRLSDEGANLEEPAPQD
jgi:hypothetical protein